MKNKMYLMIFYADGRSRNIGFDLIRSAKSAILITALTFFAFTWVIAYNFYQLSNARSVYTQTMQKLSLEQQGVKSKLVALENFEEKISFFLGGVLEDNENPGNGIDFAGAMGGGEELEAVEDSPMEAPSEGGDIMFKAASHESESTESRVTRLKQRLDELADLALQEKKRLDFTPSIMPTIGYLTSGFGWRKSPFTGKRHFHRGVDVVNKLGTPVKSTAEGKVVFAGTMEYWGNCVFISHRDGIISKYGHLNSFDVAPGQEVKRGEVIGYIGMSGRTTGPHLHYQIEIRDKAVNPLQFVISEFE